MFDAAAATWVWGGAWGAVTLLGVLAGVLLYGAWPAITRFGVRFLWSTSWDYAESFGAWPVIEGTLLSSLMAVCLAVPLGVGAAVFLVRLAPRWLAVGAGFLIELLAAIPSIAYGMWGALVMTPWLNQYASPLFAYTIAKLRWIPWGIDAYTGEAYYLPGDFLSPLGIPTNVFAGGVILAIMILPIITAVTRDVLLAVPGELEQGAYALGATWWQATRMVLSYTKMGILVAVILGLGRALGETMAVTRVIGGTVGAVDNLFKPGATIASVLANEFPSPQTGMHRSALIYAALVLLVMTMLVNTLARMLVISISKKGRNEPSARRRCHEPEGAGTGGDKIVFTGKLGVGWWGNSGERPYNRLARVANRLMQSFCSTSAGVAMLVLMLITGYLVYKGFSSLSLDLFLKNLDDEGQRVGLRNGIEGTAVLIGLASLMGVPVGMACGVCLAEYAKKAWITSIIRLVVDVLVGVPSIIIGVLVFELVVLPWGQSAWAGALALAFIMIPIVARTTEEMLRLVPQSYREASIGVGASKAQTLFRVILPAAKGGIITGVMLAVARVAGETAPLIFTVLGSDQPVFRWSGGGGSFIELNRFFPALTLQIWKNAEQPDNRLVNQAWAGMLILMFLILALNLGVRHFSRAKPPPAKKA